MGLGPGGRGRSGRTREGVCAMMLSRRVGTLRRLLARSVVPVSAGAVLLGLSALVWALTSVAGSPSAEAASVTPVFLSGASNDGKTCADLKGPGQTWIE